MCDICQQTPCVHGCPNEPKPPVVKRCNACGQEIREGDEYIWAEKFEDAYCMDCATVMIAEVDDE